VVGQPPQLVEQYDDKNYVNTFLRNDGSFNMPKSWIVDSVQSPILADLPYPIVGKPIRGRGSHGVRVCHTQQELQSHLNQILSESPLVMLEEYLSGQEGTVTIMPPSEEIPRYWAMPIVVRFNHIEGIAPYSGVVAVTANSRVPSDEEFESSTAFREVCEQCERLAEKLKVTAPIRVDVRRYNDSPDARFALFDVNVKPVRLNPGHYVQACSAAVLCH
jgi:D-alanine-D-alanine ligase-like ATP-grasp enzyme